MKDTDEAVDRVLAGLREAEVPGGLEERVLRAVREREASVEKARFFGRLSGSVWPRKRRSGVFAAGSAVVIAIVLICAAVYRFGGRSEMAQPEAAGRAAAPMASVRIAQVEPVIAAGPRTPRRSTWVRDRGMRGGDATNLAEPLLVSYPAPPMPLTEQERLLLKVAHKSDPVEIAMLDVASWRGEVAEGRAEFQRFFKVPAVAPLSINEWQHQQRQETGNDK